LFGVTGSGKTEIYLHLIAHALASGRQALVLVPEIALTPALQAAFAARFPGAAIAVQHSGMPALARAAGWLDAQHGRADIVLGTRLAAFVPLLRPGIIVIDEEQDSSFKQQEGLRYNARDLAIYRASVARIPVVLVSATPSLESYRQALLGRYRLHVLSARAHAAARMPAVHLVDTRRHPTQQGLSEPVIQAMESRLARGEQSLVFLNRRGYAPVLACPACGWISDCPDCAAHLVLHLADKRLRCHHCGHATAIPRACPSCGNLDLQPLGRGTQRLEATLAERFPAARVLRIDGDSTRRRGSLEELLEEVRDGRANILLGTQMLAKGHHFENLTLVVVLNADAGLFAADYRSGERLFAQLEQVAGRAGRAGLPGEVWIQTRFPGHALYQALARHDYAGFAEATLRERSEAGFPPFIYEAALRAESLEGPQALAFLREALAAAPPDQEGITLFQPVPMAMPRLAKMERAQVVLQAASRTRLQRFLGAWAAALYGLRPRAVRWHLDVDPTEF
jgi:primosomal protein N' (replication factor Y)